MFGLDRKIKTVKHAIRMYERAADLCRTFQLLGIDVFMFKEILIPVSMQTGLCRYFRKRVNHALDSCVYYVMDNFIVTKSIIWACEPLNECCNYSEMREAIAIRIGMLYQILNNLEDENSI